MLTWDEIYNWMKYFAIMRYLWKRQIFRWYLNGWLKLLQPYKNGVIPHIKNCIDIFTNKIFLEIIWIFGLDIFARAMMMLVWLSANNNYSGKISEYLCDIFFARAMIMSVYLSANKIFWENIRIFFWEKNENICVGYFCEGNCNACVTVCC